MELPCHPLTYLVHYACKSQLHGMAWHGVFGGGGGGGGVCLHQVTMWLPSCVRTTQLHWEGSPAGGGHLRTDLLHPSRQRWRNGGLDQRLLLCHLLHQILHFGKPAHTCVSLIVCMCVCVHVRVCDLFQMVWYSTTNGIQTFLLRRMGVSFLVKKILNSCAFNF